MKKYVCVLFVVFFVFMIIGVPAQAGKAGEIKDDIYTDSDYGFSFKIPTGWSAQVKKSKSALRVAINQKTPVPPRHFQGDLQDYMQIPAIRVLVDTTSLTVDQFIDSLLDSKFKSKQKKGMMKLLTLISRPHDIQKRKEVTIAGEKATLVEARQAYSMEVSSRGSDRANVINDYKSGAILFTVREGQIYVIHLICEYQTSGPIFDIFGAMISSLKFEGAAEETIEEKSG